MCTSPSGVYLAGKLQWHFACGFNFGHSLRLTFVTTFVVLKRLGIALSGLGGGVWAVSRIRGSACVCLAFWDLSCWWASVVLCLFRFWIWSGLPFVAAFAALGRLGGPFRAGGERGLWAMSKIEISVRTSLAFRGLSCW